MLDSPNVKIPYVPEGTLDPAAGLNLAINVIDALLQPRVIDMSQTAPPATGVDGDMYIVASPATGAWAGKEDWLARYVYPGEFWQFYEPGVQVSMIVNDDDGVFYVYDPLSSPPGWTQVQGGGGGGGGAAIVINVVSYGASGDGSTDDTSAVQDAIDAAEALVASAEGQPVTVYFPAGQYLVDPLYVGSSNVTLAGDGAATIIRRKAATVTNTDSIGAINFHGSSGSPISNVRQRDMLVDGNKANITVGGGGDVFDVECVSFDYCIAPRVDNVIVINATSEGLDFDNCEDGVVRGLHGEGNGGCAIHFSTSSTRMAAIGCTANTCGIDLLRGAFDVHSSATHCRYEACTARDSYVGFVLAGNYNAAIGCAGIGNTTNGLRVEGNSNSLSGCTADGNTGNGVTVTGARNVLSACVSINNTQQGFGTVSGAVNNSFVGCIATGNGTNGLRFPSGANNNIAVGCQLAGNTGTSYDDGGTGNTSSANKT